MNAENLYRVICSRKGTEPEKSYTARLFQQGEDEILKKVGEEAVEVVLAGKGQSDQRLVEEVADLTYHVLVLMAQRNITPDMIEAELERRHK